MTDISDRRVLVTPTSYGRHDPSLRTRLEEEVGEVLYNDRGRPLKVEELTGIIRDVDGYIAGLDPIDEQVLDAAERLQVIARYGVGVDNVDLDTAEQKGIVVCNTPGANAGSVAELTIGLMLALAREICPASSATKEGKWPRVDGTMIEGKVVGLIGLGAIGSAVARRMQAFDCRLVAHDPYVAEDQASQLDVELLELNELLPQADYVSLHCPLTAETENLVDAGFLVKMKEGARLINTARGELLDEKAVAEALRQERLAGVALDAYRQQPPAPSHSLLDLPHVLATPHMGSHTDGAVNAMGEAALADCLAVLRGEPPQHRVI